MCNKVLAHFNPRSYWNTTNVTEAKEALPMCEELGWDLLQGVLDVVGVAGVLLLPASAIENNRESDVVAASFEVPPFLPRMLPTKATALRLLPLKLTSADVHL